MRSFILPLALVVTALTVVACDDAPLAADADVDATVEERQLDLGDAVAVCAYDPFEATIHEGPNAGTAVVGKLVLAADKLGQLTGVLRPAKKGKIVPQDIPVYGHTGKGAIDLTFLLPGGGEINGQGGLDAAFAACPDPIVGELVGPEPGDVGDWGGYGSRCYSDCRALGYGFGTCLVGCGLFY